MCHNLKLVWWHATCCEVVSWDFSAWFFHEIFFRKNVPDESWDIAVRKLVDRCFHVSHVPVAVSCFPKLCNFPMKWWLQNGAWFQKKRCVLHSVQVLPIRWASVRASTRAALSSALPQLAHTPAVLSLCDTAFSPKIANPTTNDTMTWFGSRILSLLLKKGSFGLVKKANACCQKKSLLA